MPRAKGGGATRRFLAAKSSFSVDLGGAITTFSKGDIVDDGDPVLRKHKHMFEEPHARRYGPQRATNDAPVEQATAAPGERREHTHTHPH